MHIIRFRKAVPQLILVFSSGNDTDKVDRIGRSDGAESSSSWTISSSSSSQTSSSSSSSGSSRSSMSMSMSMSGSTNNCGSMDSSRRVMCESTEYASSRMKMVIFLWPSAGFCHGCRDLASASGFSFKIQNQDSRQGLHIGF